MAVVLAGLPSSTVPPAGTASPTAPGTGLRVPLASAPFGVSPRQHVRGCFGAALQAAAEPGSATLSVGGHVLAGTGRGQIMDPLRKVAQEELSWIWPWHSTSWHSTAQHGRVQHVTARHGTQSVAQHTMAHRAWHRKVELAQCSTDMEPQLARGPSPPALALASRVDYMQRDLALNLPAEQQRLVSTELPAPAQSSAEGERWEGAVPPPVPAPAVIRVDTRAPERSDGCQP